MALLPNRYALKDKEIKRVWPFVLAPWHCRDVPLFFIYKCRPLKSIMHVGHLDLALPQHNALDRCIAPDTLENRV
jgi:hypothetical protein